MKTSFKRQRQWMMLHSIDALSPQIDSAHRTEPVSLEPHSLVADVDPTLEADIFDKA